MPPASEDASLSRSRAPEQIERFVAFAFAAADLVAEVEPDGTITYAAGAFRSRLGRSPDDVIGQNLRSVVADADHKTLDMGLELLRTRGRLAPTVIRLQARGEPRLALAGLALGPPGCPARFCVTFAVLPAPTPAAMLLPRDALARTVAASTAGEVGSNLALIEVAGGAVSSVELERALRSIAPDSIASELSPGRFGVFGPEGPQQLATTVGLLEEALRTSNGANLVTAQLSSCGTALTASQAARALGQALITFARDGADGLERSGFGGGLGAFMDRAARQTNALRRLIEQRQFELAFQPVVSLADGRLHHFEALLRLEADRTQRTPQEFVLLVEMLGLAHELDLAVADLACAAALRAPAPLAFNISGQSMGDAEFRARLQSLLTAHPAARDRRLLVEMTETAEAGNLDEAARTVAMVRGLAIPFCLDDFGAGAADLRMLRALGADLVKLDGSFVPGLVSDGRDRGFVAGVIEIARAAGAAVVAERIETEAEAAALLAAGATYGQGWLFGKPGALPRREEAVARRSGGRECWG